MPWDFQTEVSIDAEEILDYERFASEFYESSNKSQGDAIGLSVSKSCIMLDAKLVVIVSNSFTAARKLAKFKIKAPILAVVKDKNLAISLNGLYYAITAIYAEREQDFTYEEKDYSRCFVACNARFICSCCMFGRRCGRHF